MIIAKNHVDLHNIRASVLRIGNLSDNVFHFGPVKLGLESVLEFVPYVGEGYSLIAGMMLLFEGVRARVPTSTLMSVATIVLVRTLLGASDVIPGVAATVVGVVGNLAAGLFAGHKIAADMIVKAMDDTVYVEGSHAEASRDPEVAAVLAAARAGREHRRIIFLGDVLIQRGAAAA